MLERSRRTFALAGLAALLSACQNPNWHNDAALRIGAPRANAPEIRARQSERVAAAEEQALVEATQVLQDLGFTAEESAPNLGVLAGSKNRDATEAGQVAAQVALTVAAAFLGVRHQPVWDTDQVIRVTLTTRPLSPRESNMRVSFERVVTINQGVSRMEELNGPEFSSGFFSKVRNGLAANGG